MFQAIIDTLFGCQHSRTTFPITPVRRIKGHIQIRTKSDLDKIVTPPPYVVCLDCGKEFNYDWDNMRITTQRDRVVHTKLVQEAAE